MTPMLSSQAFDLLVLALLVGPITVLSVVAAVQAWRARRREQLLADRRTDLQIGQGMRSAWRRGWITDGDE